MLSATNRKSVPRYEAKRRRHEAAMSAPLRILASRIEHPVACTWHLLRSLHGVAHEHNARRERSRLDQAQVEAHPVSKQLLATAQHDGIDQQAIFVHQIVLR